MTLLNSELIALFAIQIVIICILWPIYLVYKAGEDDVELHLVLLAYYLFTAGTMIRLFWVANSEDHHSSQVDEQSTADH